jgi:predicted membrane protein
MFGDILVGALLFISGIINLLAIGAFWITPSLRTTANRFVINLLLVNFISCLILSPFAFNAFNVNANSPTDAIASSSSSSASQTTFNYNTSEFPSSDVVVEVIENSGNKTECSNGTHECLTNDASVNLHLLDAIENISLRMYQTWSLDLVVALSVLSVLLVILDTFIAVTDPLRYHARISDCKAWLLIALCWILSITFGIASALRADARFFAREHSENFANIIFLSTYFILIIISPFMLVILMYWRIYSEARENGQRMRQNGSSPLLQSALNLAATAAAHQQQSQIITNPQCVLLLTSSPIQANKQPPLNKQPPCDSSIHNYFHHNHQNNNNNNSTHVNDGLTMRIDKQDYCNNNINQQINLNINGMCINNNNNNNNNINSNNEIKTFSDTKTFLLSSPPHECMPMIDAIDETSLAVKSQQHQNILLTLTTVCEQTIKRNHSVKHLLTDTELGDETKVVELRQVQSTPNLQRTASTLDISNNGQEQILELPSIQASPKALRYMTSLRHRLSNASSLFKYREEGRAARISILGKHSFLRTLYSLEFV